MIVIPIFVDDLEEAKEFYCSILKFEKHGSIESANFLIKNNPFLSKNEISSTVFCIRKPRDSGFSKKMHQNHYRIDFENFDVKGLYDAIIDKIPTHEGPAEEMPNGHYYGMYECPGGCYLTINDPFGNHLSFTEW